MALAQDIESRIQILDIVNRYVSTKKAGVNYKGLCPFHSEKSPSFVISPTKNIAHCFSCGKGGGPINFLMEIEKIDFREAITILAKEAGIEMKTQFSVEQSEKGKDLYKLYKEATEWYHQALFLPENSIALSYLTDRKISIDTIKRFQLGYSSSPRDLLFYLKNTGFETSFIIDSGLFVSETRDKFFGRITFPIANTMGHTVAFTGRVLTDALPKYLNSPASHIFDKSSILYGLHLAKQAVSKLGEVFIVEGQMDTIALHQASIDNAVGISGTALTKDHIRSLKRFARTIYLALDSDNAGIKATFSSIENLLNEDIEIRIIQIPNGKDPDEYIKSGGDFLSLRETSLSVIEFYLREGGREYDINTLIGKKKLIEKCLEIIVRLGSQLEVDFYLQEISRQLIVGMDALYSEYRKIKSDIQRKKTVENKFETQKEGEKDVESSGKKYAPSLADMIAGYIYRYQFLDLFSANFLYTVDDLTNGTDTALLSRTLLSTLESDDIEMLRIIDLHLESDHINANPELIERAFRDLLRGLHSFLFSS
ncbi:DNA primase [Candidatus Gracilibacteria bacterium]|nr:DNA primase [Candidatus Gracilibacteria bacterium]